MRGLAFVSLMLLSGAGVALAQPTLPALRISAEMQRVIDGVMAQYQAALIRERRLANAQQLQTIAENEARLTNARRRADARVAGAEVELELARAAFAQLVESIALQDAASRAEIEAYKAQAGGLAARATPELLAAYQRFADGDRIGAWPVIETLTEAQVRATMSAAGARAAVGLRDAVRARDIMRIRGEARRSDVLELLDRAAALDPSDFGTQLARARFASMLGETPKALDAARQAQRIAQTTREKSAALVVIGRIQQEEYPSAALRAYEESLRIDRGLLSREPGDPELMRRMAVTLNNTASILEAPEPGAAMRAYQESLSISRELLAKEPEDVQRTLDLSKTLQNIGQMLERKNLTAAVESYAESLSVCRDLLKSERGNVELLLEAASSLSLISNISFKAGDTATARRGLAEVVAITQELLRSDPENFEAVRLVGKAHAQLFLLQEADAGQQLAEAHRFFKVLAENGALSPQDRPLFDVLDKALSEARPQ